MSELSSKSALLNPPEYQQMLANRTPTAEEIIELVECMRAKQKEYFRTHMRQVLQESKDLEKAVDKALAKYRQPAIL